MIRKKSTCERCQHATKLEGHMFCAACCKAQRDAANDRVCAGLEVLYNSMQVKYGLALCDKVQARHDLAHARRDLARERVANEGLQNDVAKLKARLRDAGL